MLAFKFHILSFNFTYLNNVSNFTYSNLLSINHNLADTSVMPVKAQKLYTSLMFI